MIKNIFFAGGWGCLIFMCFLVLAATSGIAAAMRDEEGNFKKGWPLKKWIGIVLFIAFLLGILTWGNLRLLEHASDPIGWGKLWINSFGIFMVIHLFDLIVLDYLIIVKWHPPFLNLPDTPYYRTIEPHVKGFLRGIPIGIAAALLASGISLATS